MRTYILIVIVIVIAILTQMVHKKYTEHMTSCPAADAPFKHKKFVKNPCFAHEDTDCRSVIQKLGIPELTYGMSKDDYDAALNVLGNNLYMNNNPADGMLYSTNECVITEYDQKSLGMTGCQLGDIQLTKSNNNDDPEVSWSYPDGCVISTPQLSTSLGSILTEINKKSKEKKQETKDNISNSIKDNNTATTQHNEATSQNNTNTSINKRSAEDVRRTTRASKSNTANLLADESSYNSGTTSTSATANTEQNKYNNMKLDCQTGWTAVNDCNATCGASTWGYYASGTQRYRTYISRRAQNGGVSSCREGVQQDFGCSRWCQPTLANGTTWGYDILNHGFYFKVTARGSSFNFNLRSGQWSHVIPFHLSARAHQNEIILNTHVHSWGGEEKVPYSTAGLSRHHGGGTIYVYAGRWWFYIWDGNWRHIYSYSNRIRDYAVTSVDFWECDVSRV